MRYIWTVSVRDHRDHKKFRITGNDGEPIKDVYQKVKKVIEQIKEKLGDRKCTIEAISNTHAFKPQGIRPSIKYMWCPYCVKYRIFVVTDDSGNKKCPICGISDQDYHVKKHNDIWKKEWLAMANKKEVKK